MKYVSKLSIAAAMLVAAQAQAVELKQPAQLNVSQAAGSQFLSASIVKDPKPLSWTPHCYGLDWGNPQWAEFGCN